MSNLLKDAIKAHQQGELEQAELLYQTALETEPNNFDALVLLGILHTQTQHYRKAKECFLHALQINSKSGECHNYLANVFSHLNEPEQALQYFDKAIQLGTNLCEVHNNFGNHYYRYGNFTKAIEQYQQAIQYNPKQPDTYNNLGMCYLQQQEIELAKINFEQALALDSDNIKTLHFLANIAYEQQQLVRAIELYQHVLKLAPHHIDSLVNLAASYLKQNKKNESVEQLQLAIKLAPQHKEARINLAAIYLIDRHYHEAKEQYLDLLAFDPNNYSAHFNLGVIYMRQEKWDDAAFHYELALGLQPEDADAHNNYATCLLKQGQDQAAIEQYQKALALKPKDEALQYRLAALTGETKFDQAPATYVTSLFDHYAEHFDRDLVEKLHYQAPSLIYQALATLISDKQRRVIADLGCGTGLCGEQVKALASYLIGIDISEEMIAAARTKNIYDELIIADIMSALSSIEKPIDIITAADVFCYFGNLQPIMASCSHALADQGLLAFTTELNQTQDYSLQKTGRFCHSKNYLQQLATENSFQLLLSKTVVLRQQQDKQVKGLLTVFQKLIRKDQVTSE